MSNYNRDKERDRKRLEMWDSIVNALEWAVYFDWVVDCDDDKAALLDQKRDAVESVLARAKEIDGV